MAAKIESCLLQLALLCLILGVQLVVGNWKCADKSCGESISLAKTVVRYDPQQDDHLEYDQGRTIRILAKPADRIGELWIGEVDNEVGYVPKRHVKEFRMYHPKPPVDAENVKVKTKRLKAHSSASGNEEVKEETKEGKKEEPNKMEGMEAEKQDGEVEGQADTATEQRDAQDRPDEKSGGMFGGMFGGGGSEAEKEAGVETEKQENAVPTTVSPDKNVPELMSQTRQDQHEQYLQQVRQNFLRRRHAPGIVHSSETVDELNNLLDKKSQENTEKSESTEKEIDAGLIDYPGADLDEYQEAKLPSPTESEASAELPSGDDAVNAGTKTVMSSENANERKIKQREEEIEPSMPMHMRQTQAVTPDAEFNEYLYSSFDITPSASGTIAGMPQINEEPDSQSGSGEKKSDEQVKDTHDDTSKIEIQTDPIPASKVTEEKVPSRHAEIKTPPLTDKPQKSHHDDVDDKITDKLSKTSQVTQDPRDHPPITEVDTDVSEAKLKQGSSYPAVSQPGGSIDLSEPNNAPDVYIANMGVDGEMLVRVPSKENDSDSGTFVNNGGGDSDKDISEQLHSEDTASTNANSLTNQETLTESHFPEEKENVKEELPKGEGEIPEESVNDETDTEAGEDEDDYYDDEDDSYYDEEDEDDGIVETEGDEEVIEDENGESKKLEKEANSENKEPGMQYEEGKEKKENGKETLQENEEKVELKTKPEDEKNIEKETPPSVEDRILRERLVKERERLEKEQELKAAQEESKKDDEMKSQIKDEQEITSSDKKSDDTDSWTKDEFKEDSDLKEPIEKDNEVKVDAPKDELSSAGEERKNEPNEENMKKENDDLSVKKKKVPTATLR